MKLARKFMSDFIGTLEELSDSDADMIVEDLFLDRQLYVPLKHEYARTVLVEHTDKVRKDSMQKEIFREKSGGYHLNSLEGDQWQALHKGLLPTFSKATVRSGVDTAKQYSQKQFEELSSNESIELPRAFSHINGEVAFDVLFRDRSDVPREELQELKRVDIKYNQPGWRALLDSQLPKPVPTKRRRLLRRKNAALDEELAPLIRRGDCTLSEQLNGFSEEQILGAAKMVMLAGTNPTMMTLLTYLVGTNDLGAALRRDLPDEITYEYVSKKNSLLENILNETLRYYPMVPLITRRAVQPVPCGGTTIPENSVIVIPLYSLHRSDRYWSDPDRFDPHRWESMTPSSKDGYLPFGMGPRKCIAEYLVRIHSKILLATLFNNYEVDVLTEQFETNYLDSANLYPDPGVRARVDKLPTAVKVV